MTVVSKFFKKSFDKFEELGCSKEVLSRGLLGATVFAYCVKLSYPHLKKHFDEQKSSSSQCDTNENNNTITKTSQSSEDSDGENTENPELRLEKLITKTCQKKLQQPGLNLDFLLQLRKLVEIMIPSLVCTETVLLSFHTLCLISRTFLSIYVASMEGAIVKFIVRRDIRNFVLMLCKWFGIAIPATFINSMIRYLENKLALAFR
jgi:ATP-binding cassette subfamily D (ALD) protein 2